jgi:hypothetical protein
VPLLCMLVRSVYGYFADGVECGGDWDWDWD